MHTVAPLALPAARDTVDELVLMDPNERMYQGFLARYQTKPATARAYKQDLKNYFDWCAWMRLNPITAEEPHVQLYYAWLVEQDVWSQSTIARRIGTVCGMYKNARRQRLIEHDPCEFIERPKIDYDLQRRTLWSPLEHAAALKWTWDNGSVMDRAYMAVVGLCALRIREACNLTIEDYRMRGGYRVLTFIGKGSKSRQVRVPVIAMPAIEAAIGDRTDGWLLLNTAGRQLTRANGARIAKRIARSAGIDPDVSNHSLRRSVVTSGRASGLSLDELAQILGHASTSTTQRYDGQHGNLSRNKIETLAGFLADNASLVA